MNATMREGCCVVAAKRKALPGRGNGGLWRCIRAHPVMYMMMIPGILFMIIFRYLPMYGIVLAFKEWNVVKGIFGSPWIGLENFTYLFGSRDFTKVLRNSLWISFIRLLWGFPVPILLSLLLNEARNQPFKRTVQTLLYLPHFISWVIIAGLVMNFTSMNNGIINAARNAFGLKSIAFLQSERYFRSVLVISEIWKEAGWGTIVYLAAISGIDPTLYEAAIVDGATRMQRMRYITLPGIIGTIVVLLILRTGSILNNGFEQIYMLYSPLVYDVADVFETYSYRVGLAGGRFSYGTAIGMFQSIVGMVLIFSTNMIAKRLGGGGLW